MDRALVPLGAFAIALVLAPAAPALAQDYPAKPIRLVIPFPAGSATDLTFLKDGRPFPLAATTARRPPVMPDVPTMAEAALPGYEFQAWFGVFAPARAPRPVVEKIGREIARIVELPDIKKQMQAQAEEGRASTPEQFATFVRAEIDKIGTIVKQAGVRIE